MSEIEKPAELDEISTGNGGQAEKGVLYSAGQLIEDYFEWKNRGPKLTDEQIREKLEADFKLSMEITEKMLVDLKAHDVEVLQVYFRLINPGDIDILVVIKESDYDDYDKITYSYELTDNLCDQSINPDFSIDVGFMPKAIHFNQELVINDGYRLIYGAKI